MNMRKTGIMPGHLSKDGEPEEVLFPQLPYIEDGNINSPERIGFINEINPWAFTMGSALFTENFAPGKSFRENLEEVVRIMDSIE